MKIAKNIKKDSWTVESHLARKPDSQVMQSVKSGGDHALTDFEVLERGEKYALVQAQPHTGRTHQIRVHMSSIGHPILGDEIYGPAKCPYKLQGQTLHAKILGITHPSTGEYIEFDAPLPDYFKDLLNKLRKQN